MSFVVIGTYIIFMAIFIAMSALIVRHTVKYSYLSQRFKYIVFTFGLLALGVIFFSIYLIFALLANSPDSGSPSFPSTSSGSGINF